MIPISPVRVVLQVSLELVVIGLPIPLIMIVPILGSLVIIVTLKRSTLSHVLSVRF